MLDFIADLRSQQHTANLANSARPDSPIVDEDVRRRNVGFSRVAGNRMSTALRRSAYRLDPAQDCPPIPRRKGIKQSNVSGSRGLESWSLPDE